MTQNNDKFFFFFLKKGPTIQQCKNLLQKLKKHKMAWPFNTPVDYVKLQIPDYPTVITQPMDLGTIGNKFKNNEYKDYKQFVSDVNLVWNNCITYNGENSDVSFMAKKLKEYFETQMEKLIAGELLFFFLAQFFLIFPFHRFRKCKESINKQFKEDQIIKGWGEQILPFFWFEISHLKKKLFCNKKFGETQLSHVKKFVEKLKQEPVSLKMPKLQFFKDFLDEFKPEPAPPANN